MSYSISHTEKSLKERGAIVNSFSELGENKEWIANPISDTSVSQRISSGSSPIGNSSNSISFTLLELPKEIIESFYSLRDRKEVFYFLKESLFLIPLLIEATNKIKNYFSSSELFLEVVPDPETQNQTQLVLFIQVDLQPEEALEKLEKFDQDWWLSKLDQTQNKLCITLEYQ